MELLQLKYFQELAKSEQLTQTAQKLHIAQPSLSQTLKRLENELGTPLFDRVGKRIVLNAQGQIFLKYVEKVFEALDQAGEEMAAAGRRENKTVALHVYAASLLLPQLIREIQKADPGIYLRIYQQPVRQEQQLPGLHGDRRAADIEKIPALYLTASPFCAESENVTPLLEERILAALPQDHPLAGKETLYSSDLKDEPFISLSPDSPLARMTDQYCRDIGFAPAVSVWADNPSMVRELLKLKLGISMVPERTWHGFAGGKLVLKPIADLPMKRYILLSGKDGGQSGAALELCRKTIIDFFSARFGA